MSHSSTYSDPDGSEPQVPAPTWNRLPDSLRRLMEDTAASAAASARERLADTINQSRRFLSRGSPDTTRDTSPDDYWNNTAPLRNVRAREIVNNNGDSHARNLRLNEEHREPDGSVAERGMSDRIAALAALANAAFHPRPSSRVDTDNPNEGANEYYTDSDGIPVPRRSIVMSDHTTGGGVSLTRPERLPVTFDQLVQRVLEIERRFSPNLTDGYADCHE